MRIVLALALAVGLLLTSGPARAEDPAADHRPCVANREANSVKGVVSRYEVETRWEVRGKGQVWEIFGSKVVTYPWCDHGSRARAWVGIIYGPRRRVLVVIWYKEEWLGLRQVSGKAALPLDSTGAVL